jgi:hypothetical protein
VHSQLDHHVSGDVLPIKVESSSVIWGRAFSTHWVETIAVSRGQVFFLNKIWFISSIWV